MEIVHKQQQQQEQHFLLPYLAAFAAGKNILLKNWFFLIFLKISLLRDGSVPGIIFSQGPAWREQRRFALSALRSLGLGRLSMGAVAEAEAADLCDHFESLRGRAVDVRNEFNVSVLSVLWHLVKRTAIF